MVIPLLSSISQPAGIASSGATVSPGSSWALIDAPEVGDQAV